MKFDIDFILSIFVSQTLFAAIINLVDLIRTIVNNVISKSYKLKSFYCKYSIYINPFISFIFFFIIGIITSVFLTNMRFKSRCEIESEKRRKRQIVLDEMKETIENNESEKILIKYLSLTNTLLDQ